LIKIEIPKCSDRFAVSEVDKVKPDPGFYYFRDANGTIVYIGEALNLRKRLRRHMSGTSSVTGRFHQVFETVEIFYCDKKDRKIYEVYAINKFSPPGNVQDNNIEDKSVLTKNREKWIMGLS